jgi:hypothetical protein
MMAKKSDAPQANETVRVTLRMPRDVHEKLKFWAGKKEYSVNDFVPYLIEYFELRESGNYELPSLEIMRLNQLSELVIALTHRIDTLESIIINGFSSLTTLTRGDNYLMEATETGEF